MRRVFVCVCSCAALMLCGGAASGFCRTTTSTAPAGYNPATSGCWTGGTPLSWPVDRVPYAVASTASRQVSLSEATRIADLAFSAWNGVLCGGKALSIEAYDDGPISLRDAGEGDALATWAQCSDSSSCNSAAHDIIVFDDDSWPYSDPVNTLALTTVTYGVDDGHIFQAYTEVNSAQHLLTTTEPPPAGQAYDLQAVLTHEAGHFLGLAHATDTSAIMYALYQPGAIRLSADDVQGICAVYPPGRSVGTAGAAGSAGTVGKCSCEAVGVAPGPAVAGTLSIAMLACLRRRRLRRAARATWSAHADRPQRRP